jgi:hypothetical protein
MTLLRVRPLQIFSLAILFSLCGVALAANSNSHNPSAPSQSSAAQTQSTQTQSAPAAAPQIPKIDGGIGACTANFTVRDGANKPLYNAQITVELRYGFLNKRKTDLQIGTDSNGKADFTGLPNFPKKPLEFHIKSGTVSKTVIDDPESNCVATFNEVLTVH